jgi:hypothetical protein
MPHWEVTMRRHDEDADGLIGAEHDEYPQHAPPVHERRPTSGATPFILRERPVHAASWPLDTISDQEVEARRNLEHVGRILQRLDWEQAEILQLRRETHAMLAQMVA